MPEAPKLLGLIAGECRKSSIKEDKDFEINLIIILKKLKTIDFTGLLADFSRS